jgi:23S rRNA (guanine745-N1)-methyltransferase
VGWGGGAMIHSAIRPNIHMFECPLCGAGIENQDEGSLYCANGHCFDFARKGYVNFLNASVKTKYSKMMFHSREIVIKSGFFDPVVEFIGTRLAERGWGRDAAILDAGCGEGSFLAGVGRRLMNLSAPSAAVPVLAGFDISKFGIQLAASSHPDFMWCVADLTRIPFKKEQFDYILNILAPAHYDEFGRCLKKDGLLIKVVPSEDHLKEIRAHYYGGTEKQSYSNQDVTARFQERFGVLEKLRLKYSFKPNGDQLIYFIQMTPLSWHVADEKPMTLPPDDELILTADFTVLIGGQ